MASPSVWDEDSQCYVHVATIAAPAGGATQDANARAAIGSILTVLQGARIMAKDTNATEEPFAWGPTVWDNTYRTFVFSEWISVTAGGTSDAESRTAIGSIATALSQARLIGWNTGISLSPMVWDEDLNQYVHAAVIAAPAGGGTVDTEARTAIGSIITALKAAGVVAND